MLNIILLHLQTVLKFDLSVRLRIDTVFFCVVSSCFSEPFGDFCLIFDKISSIGMTGVVDVYGSPSTCVPGSSTFIVMLTIQRSFERIVKKIVLS